MSDDGMPTDVWALDVICLHGKSEDEVRPLGSFYHREIGHLSPESVPHLPLWRPFDVETLYWFPERPGQLRPDPHWGYTHRAFGRAEVFKDAEGRVVHPLVTPNPSHGPLTVADPEKMTLVCRECSYGRRQRGGGCAWAEQTYYWSALSPALDELVLHRRRYIDMRDLQRLMTVRDRRPRPPRC